MSINSQVNFIEVYTSSFRLFALALSAAQVGSNKFNQFYSEYLFPSSERKVEWSEICLKLEFTFTQL